MTCILYYVYLYYIYHLNYRLYVNYFMLYRIYNTQVFHRHSQILLVFMDNNFIRIALWLVI